MIRWLQPLGAILLVFALLASASPAQKKKKIKDLKPAPRTVWDLTGGAVFITDGQLENGSCFRFSGRATAPEFFDNLKRVDDENGTTYTHDGKVVTEFPEQLDVALTIRDSPCSFDLKATAVRPPLTREAMSQLQLRLFWKDGIHMKRVEKYTADKLVITPLEPYSSDAAPELPKRFQWNYTLVVPSGGVPLTNSLVFAIVTPEGKIAARSAARL